MDRNDIIAVFKEWEANFAPPRFLPTDKNARLLTAYLLDQGGTISITSITAAVKALEGALDWKPEETEKQKFLRLQAAENARLKRDQRENQPIVPKEYKEATNTFDPKEIARRTARDKANAASLKQAKAIIAGYAPTHSLGVDYSEQGKMQAHWNTKLQEALDYLKTHNDWDFPGWVTALAKACEARYVKAEKARELSR